MASKAPRWPGHANPPSPSDAMLVPDIVDARSTEAGSPGVELKLPPSLRTRSLIHIGVAAGASTVPGLERTHHVASNARHSCGVSTTPLSSMTVMRSPVGLIMHPTSARTVLLIRAVS